MQDWRKHATEWVDEKEAAAKVAREMAVLTCPEISRRLGEFADQLDPGEDTERYDER